MPARLIGSYTVSTDSVLIDQHLDYKSKAYSALIRSVRTRCTILPLNAHVFHTESGPARVVNRRECMQHARAERQVKNRGTQTCSVAGHYEP